MGGGGVVPREGGLCVLGLQQGLDENRISKLSNARPHLLAMLQKKKSKQNDTMGILRTRWLKYLPTASF